MNKPNPERQRLLRLALTANALFSFTSGLFLCFASRLVVRLLGRPDESSLVSLGIGLVAFAIFLFVSARRQVVSVPQARVIVLMDILWVVGSYVLLFVVPFAPSGKWLIGVVAEFVLAFAIVQWLGIRKISKGEQHA
jgi:hypothetical protein